MISGIYLILNLITNKFYIGSAVNIRIRWNLHKHHLNKNKHPNRHLQAAWNKYGEEAFKFIIIQFVEKENLIKIEQNWIDWTNCYDREIGYNLSCKAGNTFGIKFSKEIKEKFSKLRTGIKQSEETKAKRVILMSGNKINNGRKQTEAHKAAILAGRKGYKPTEETKLKIGIGNRGKIISAETKAKMSAAAKERWKKLDYTSDMWV